MASGFLLTALRSFLDKKSKDKQARTAYDARYTNNPMWTLRNQLLTSLWRDNNLQERFAGAFPRQEDYQPGTSYKTPENVLINLTTPPRYTGRPGSGFDFASLLLTEAEKAAQAAAAGGGGGGGGASAAASLRPSGSDFAEFSNYQMPAFLDPFRFRR